MLPMSFIEQTDIVAGPATGGALVAHTLAGLIKGRRALSHPACSFAPFTPGEGKFTLRGFYAHLMRGKRVLWPTTSEYGKTFQRCASWSPRPEVPCSRPSDLRSDGSHRRPRRSQLRLVEDPHTENYREAECPMCAAVSR